MELFTSARIKLTVWYALIIMLVSAAFSLVIYRLMTGEFERLQQRQQRRLEFLLPYGMPPPPEFDPAVFEAAEARLRTILFIINAVILAGSAGLGYLLAGRTLAPIERMMEDQKRFVSDASHELRTPLTAMKTEIEVGLRDKQLKLTEAKALLTSNLEEVDNLQNLTSNLIQMANVDMAGADWPMTPVDTAQIATRAIKLVTPLVKAKRIRLSSSLKPLTISGNLEALTELMVILLDNAIKYSPRETEIVVKNQLQDNHVLVSVVDHGDGIAVGDLPQIFKRFFRADASRTKNSSAGYGLGLAIAKQIVDRHHGFIKVASKPGEGSTFTVQLPAA